MQIHTQPPTKFLVNRAESWTKLGIVYDELGTQNNCRQHATISRKSRVSRVESEMVFNPFLFSDVVFFGENVYAPRRPHLVVVANGPRWKSLRTFTEIGLRVVFTSNLVLGKLLLNSCLYVLIYVFNFIL